jgi:hypothetical protein
MAIKRPDTPLANTPEPNGTYMATKTGRVLRTRPVYKGEVEVESIDTTGYSKGRKVFEKKTSVYGQKPKLEKVQRKDVPKVISELKKGATRKEDMRTPNQKKQNKI